MPVLTTMTKKIILEGPIIFEGPIILEGPTFPSQAPFLDRGLWKNYFIRSFYDTLNLPNLNELNRLHFGY